MANPFDRGHFVYDPVTNRYTCPTGEILEYKMIVNSNTRKQHYKVFEGVSCDICPVKSRCTKASKRQIHQELREPLREAMRERLRSTEGKKMYQKRMNTVEHT